MSRLIDIDNERFWDILFDEACVEGNQAERIKTELEKIVAFDTEKVVEQLQNEKERYEKERVWWSEHSWKDSCCYNECDMNDRKSDCFEEAIDIVKKGGVE